MICFKLFIIQWRTEFVTKILLKRTLTWSFLYNRALYGLEIMGCVHVMDISVKTFCTEALIF